MKNVVVIGGGTGTYVVLTALKTYPLNISAIVAMSDSGGSTGRLRDQYGVLPPGDIRQALVALAEDSYIWRQLFTYRFNGGDFDGHNFGNIFLSTIEKLSGSLPEAIKISQKLLKTKGNVIPTTTEKTTLYAILENGEIVPGEHKIEELGQNWNIPVKKIKKIWLDPQVTTTREALLAIKKADFIIIGPGDLFTSILPNFLVKGMSECLVESEAKKIFITNLMTKRGQTDGFKTSDFIKEIRKYAHNLIFDYVIVNGGIIPKKVVEWYQKTSEVEPVINDINSTRKTTVILANVVCKTIYGKNISDRVQRSLIRHDPKKLGKVLSKIIFVDNSLRSGKHNCQ